MVLPDGEEEVEKAAQAAAAPTGLRAFESTVHGVIVVFLVAIGRGACELFIVEKQGGLFVFLPFGL